MSHLIKDNKELEPYLMKLIDSLKIALTDSIPEVRNISAKAFGELGRKLGKQCYILIEYLMNLLDDSKITSIERSGIA